MIFYRSLSNTDAGPFFTPLPIFGGGTSILNGAVVVRGPTADTNDGFAIVPTSLTANLTDILGVIQEPDVNTVSGADSNTTGTNYLTKKVCISPDAIYLAEYDQTSVLSVISTAGTTVTITSLEANIGRGWLYAVSGTGAGRLTFIQTSASGSCVTKEATGWDATTRVIKILPRFKKNGVLSNSGTMLGSQAAVGGSGYAIFDNMIEADSVPLQSLDPTKHSGLTGLNPTGAANALPVVRFYAQVVFTAYLATI